MKNSIRLLIAVSLAAIYCFAIGVVTNSLGYSDFRSNSNSSQEKCFSNLSTQLFCHTSQTESSLNYTNILPSPNFKNSFNGIWAIIKATGKLYNTTFTLYKTFSRNVLVNHRKTDIIFPFHYFW